ncbi:polymer-forming cytoskeletal protein [Wenzhouxiangella sp. 15190]|uniref:bactofilin family protein n=1 Tax=unclassified Wenzhouxiangella TaxID=2613841 RepID=UPI000E32799C|nr:polymer-forming cytoskeletal protein [Wenzhouxiangella sp. 15181]RFP67333.1 polymer-forming cytoskeletal protein [Wenzhouxiangella sp. 15190]
MGIINRGRPDGVQNAGTTVIAAGSKLVGDLALSDNLHVDGRIEGNVQSEAEVAIGQEGHFVGELQAEHVLVSGRFEGNVDARRLEIVAGGRVEGDVTVAELVIEPGALFNGNSKVRESHNRSQPVADRKKAAPEEKKAQPLPEAKTSKAAS